MTKQEWKEITDIAENFGTECKRVIEEVGQEKFIATQKRLEQQSKSHAEKTPAEWVRAMWRYRDAVSGRSFTERELDRVERWAFVWHCLQDQVTDQFQALILASGTTGTNNPHINTIEECLREIIDLSGLADSAWDKLNAFFNEVKALPQATTLAIGGYRDGIKGLVGRLRDAAKRVADRMKRSLQVVQELAKLATVDAELAKKKQASLVSIAGEIDKIESDLRLRVDHGEDSSAAFMTKLMDKNERFQKENPQLYKWWCPLCEWEGQLNKRQPPEDGLVNVLSKWWVWKCPSCHEMIAYDRKHPQFERYKGKSVVFNHRMWELVSDLEHPLHISLKSAAYILEAAPEWITYAAEVYFRSKLPDHVKKELEDYEQEGLDGYDGEEMPDDEDLFPSE